MKEIEKLKDRLDEMDLEECHLLSVMSRSALGIIELPGCKTTETSEFVDRYYKAKKDLETLRSERTHIALNLKLLRDGLETTHQERGLFKTIWGNLKKLKFS